MLSQGVYQLLGVGELAPSSYHPNGNGGVERVNYSMAQKLALVVNERLDNRDLRLPDVDFAYYNSVSAARGVAPNEVYMVTLPMSSSEGFRTYRSSGTPASGPRPPGLF